MKYYLYLLGAIFFGMIGSSMLKLSDGFSNLVPSIGVVVFFGITFTLFVHALKGVPLSIGYSIWSALGTAGAGLIGVLFFNEILSGINIVGLFVIIAGSVLMNIGIKSRSERNTLENSKLQT